MVAHWNPDKISVRKLTESDLPLMHRWLNTPHVSQWWEIDGKRNPDYEEVVEHFTPRIHRQEPVNCYLVLYDARPVAYIQSYRIEDFPTTMAMIKDGKNIAGTDTFIGEEDFLHKGLGEMYFRKFLKEIVFSEPRITSCIVDPDPENKIAIRAYEKAGFSYSHRAWNAKDNVPAYIMAINRESVCQ
jgi:RimJ/RimL family protein N-acetyltransferase